MLKYGDERHKILVSALKHADFLKYIDIYFIISK